MDYVVYPTSEPNAVGPLYPKLLRFQGQDDDGKKVTADGQTIVLRVKVWNAEQEADAKAKYEPIGGRPKAPAKPEKPKFEVKD
jgi:hypothetical protein